MEDQDFKKDANKIDPYDAKNASYFRERYSGKLLTYPDTSFDSEILKWLESARDILMQDPDYGIGVYLALDFGAQKYEKFSWGVVSNAKVRYTKAAIRHFFPEMYYPQDRDQGWLDDESGLHHFCHASACIAIVRNILRGAEF